MSDLYPFFPRLLLDRVHALDPSSPATTLPGACLFADVSGFTAMSEALLAMGKEGSEVLTKVLNGFYAELVDVALAQGGDVMRFAGDAVTVQFSGEAEALRAGLAMQALMPRFRSIPTPAGEFTLKMKAGVAAGEAHFFLVEGSGRRDYVYSGDPVDGSAEAEHHAEAGEVVVKRGQSFDKIKEISGEGRCAEIPSKHAEAGALAPFLHPLLWEALEAGQTALLNEHRHLSVLFVSFRSGEGDYADPVAGVRAFFRLAAERVAEYDGYINKVDMGDKGSKLLILFGAPRAHEDDEARALACAHALAQEARAAGFSVRMGLNAAKVFCGIVGSGKRCEYTVMGDGVNVAARLMQAAPEGGCLASPAVKARSGGRFAFRDLPPLTLKGKKEPLSVHLLEGLKGTEEELPFFIGRETEERILLEAMQAQPEDQAGIYVITGEAGVGKTAFVSWFLRHHQKDRRVIRHHCASHTTSIPYAAFRSLMPALLLEPDPERAVRSIINKLDPEILEYVPILLNAFGFNSAYLEEPRLEPEVHRSLLWKMVGLVLDDAMAGSGLILSIDEGQWLDDESRALLTHIVRMAETNRLIVLLTQREAPNQNEGLHRADIALELLTETETAQYMEMALSIDEVPMEAVRKLFASSHGNPLLAKETLALLFQSGYLTRDEEYPQVLLVDESKSPDLPDSIGGLVLSRLDALSLMDRTILRALSVVGDHCPGELSEGLGLDQERLMILAKSGGFIEKEEQSGGYRFTHAQAIAAIYESMEFAQRRDWHERIGRWYLDNHDKSSPGYCFLLAHHLGRAQLPEAVPYLLEVSRLAQQSFALNQAIKALETVLELTMSEVEPNEFPVVNLAQLLLLAGRSEDALKVLDRHMDRVAGNVTGEYLRVQSDAYLALGQLPRAEQALREALERAKGAHDSFMAMSQLGKFYGRTGRVQMAAEIIRKVEQQFRQFYNEKEYKLNQMRLAFIDYQMGNAGRAITSFKRLKKHFEKHHDVTAAYTVGNNLGYLMAMMGLHRKAYNQFLQSYRLIKKFSVWESEIYLNLLDNIGLQLMDLGDWLSAEKYFLQDCAYSRRTALAHLYKPLYLLGEIAIYKGDLAQAFETLNESIALCERLNLAPNEVIEQIIHAAQTVRNEEEFKDAVERYEKAIRHYEMTYLLSELDCYKAEGSIIFGGELHYIQSQQKILDDSIREGSYVDAFRSARFLLQATGDLAFLERLEQILEHCSKRQFIVSFHLLDYCFRPSLESKSRLERTIRRYPYADLAWKANVEMGKHEAPQKRRYKIRNALAITEKMLAGLSKRYSDSFKKQPQYEAMREMACDLKLMPSE